MAFPTSSLTNNQVHKEGNRAFVYDSALGVWDQVRETDITENKIIHGEIGAGVTGGSGLDKNGWLLLETQTASNVATRLIGSATTLSSTYDDYMIVGTNIKGSVATALVFRMTIGGSEATASYYTIADGIDSNAERTYTNSNGYAYAFITAGNPVNNNAYDSLCFKMYLSNPTSTVFHPKIWGYGSYTDSGGHARSTQFSARHHSTGALTALKFYFSSGNITGTFKLYGLTK